MTSSARRELVVAVVVGLVVLGALDAMHRVFLDDAWFRPSLVALGLSLGTAAAARRIGLPALGTVLLSAAGLVVYVYVTHLPPGPLLPGPAEYEAARQLFNDGVMALRDQPAPTDALPELVYLVSLGTWVVTLVTHEITVRLRRPGIALVAAGALWVIPLAMPQPTEATARAAVPFLLAAALLLLLESDADLAGWARERVAPRITAAGGVLAVAAVALGALAPGVLPGYGDPAVLDLGGSSDPRGYQPIVDIGDRLTLPGERTVLRVESDRRVYLRLAGLDSFDGNTFRVGPPGSRSFVPDTAELFPGDDELPFEQPIASIDSTVVDVEVVDLENIYVPVPYQPVEVSGDAARDMVWSRTGGFLATGELSDNELGGTLRTGVTPGLRYQVVSAIPDPTVAELREAEPVGEEVAPWLQLPAAGDWDRFAEQAREVYDQTGATSAIDRALALQYWFTTSGGFDYALEGIDRLRGPNPLETFVFDTQTGYCEYFATAMAVMLRASGIPARVAVGFLPGEQVTPADPEAGIDRAVYEVSTSDAHAWVEVLFPGQGWIKFDPTPRSGVLPPEEGNLDPQLTPSEEDALQEQEFDDSVQDTPDLPEEAEPVPLPQVPEPQAPSEQGADNGRLVLVATVLLGLVGVAAAFAMRGRAGTRLTGRAAALDAQHRLLRTAARLGIARRESETTAEALHRWGSDGRCDPAAAAELAGLLQRAAFAGHDGGDLDGARAWALGQEVTDQLRDSADRTDLVLAPVRVPATSSVEAIRDAAARVRDRVTP